MGTLSKQYVKSNADLRALTGIVINQEIQTKNFYTDINGGGGEYICVATNSAGYTDDIGGTVIGDDDRVYELQITDQAVNLETFGARGDGLDPVYPQSNKWSFEKAAEFSVGKNCTLKAGAGTFIMDERVDEFGDEINESTALGTQFGKITYINIFFSGVTKPNFKLKGQGKGLTIFKQADQKQDPYPTGLKMFYLHMKSNLSVGQLIFEDFTLDANGSSNINGSGYTWEQGHALALAPDTGQIPPTCDEFRCTNIELTDLVGGGINAYGDTIYTKVRMEGISYKDLPAAGISWRGVLEISNFSKDISMNDINVYYMQIEPTTSFATTYEKQRRCVISKSIIGNLQYTEAWDSYKYNFLTVTECKVDIAVFRGVNFKVVNSRIYMDAEYGASKGEFINSEILLKYTSATNTVENNYPHFLSGQAYPTNIKFLNCNFVINDENPALLPLGNALGEGGIVAMDNMIVTVDDCTFDSRLQGSIFAYQNGTWIIKNSKIVSKSGFNGIYLGTSSTAETTKAILENNNYEGCQGFCIYIKDRRTGCVVDMEETFVQDLLTPGSSALKLDGGIFTYSQLYKNRTLKFRADSFADAKLMFNHALPNMEIIINNPSIGDFSSYICTAAGSPTTSDWEGRNIVGQGIAVTQADSTAIDTAGIVADFNTLLAKLKDANLMS